MTILHTTERNKKVERIYIGGLDPPRLNARDVIQRLRATMDDQIEFHVVGGDRDIHHPTLDTKPYVHIQAISKQQHKTPDSYSSSSLSALEIIAKHYHNVKWKGCKLAVEAAKPHWLDRLAEERLVAEVVVVDTSETKSTNDADKIIEKSPTSPSAVHSSHHLPRRLRIRKKFGEEAFHVDTKPWMVENWNDFHRAWTKLKKRKRNDQLLTTQEQPPKLTQKQPPNKSDRNSHRVFMHRAVHLRFPDQEITNGTNHRGSNLSLLIDSAIDKEGNSRTSNSDDVEDDESYDSSIVVNDDQEVKKSVYEWSDDSDDDEDCDSVHDGSSTGSAHGESTKHSIDITNSNSTIQPEQQQQQQQIESSNRNRVENKLAKTDKEYQWSSEEEELSDSEVSETQHSNNPKKLASFRSVETFANDEFAAGVDEDLQDYSDDIERNEKDGDRIHSDNQIELKDEVTSNLNILSTLFPDMTNIFPVSLDDHELNNAEKAAKDNGATGQKSLQLSGIMPRYDPTLDFSENYETLNDAKNADTPSKQDEDRTLGRSVDERSSQVKDSDDHGNALSKDRGSGQDQSLSKEVQSIYEQDQLESVFREARTAWDQEARPVFPSHTPAENVNLSGTFTFGFALDNSNNIYNGDGAEYKELGVTSGDASRFNFSLDLPSSSRTTQQQNEPMEGSQSKLSDAGTSQNNNFLEAETRAAAEGDFPKPQRRGLSFPREDLMKYVDRFFSLNNGKKIMEDPDGFGDGKLEREQWNKERQSLTLDWKRKRKYAMSRIQKRVRR